MSKIIGLSKARKQRARTKRKEQAESNAIKFGRTKAQKKLEEAEASKTQIALDAHRLERE